MSTVTLGSFIKILELADQNKFVSQSIGQFHSFRGEPSQLAVSSCEGATVANMLKEAKSAVGKTFEGYKGGEYVMTERTAIHFSFYGSSDEYPDMFFNFIDNLF